MPWTRSIAVFLTGALLAYGCDSADIVSTVTVTDAGCARTTPPERPDLVAGDAGADEPELVFVFRSWDFLPETPNNGFDLDGICSTDAESFSCVPQEGDGVLDGVGGTDNSYANQIAPQIKIFTDLAGEDPQADLQALQGEGRLDIMLRIRGWNGTDDDARVEVDFLETACGFASDQPPEADCEGTPAPRWDGEDRFLVTEPSLLAGDTSRAMVVDDNAYVSGRVLVAELPSTMNVTFPLRGASIQLGLTDSRMVVPLPAPGEHEIPLAVLSGRWPREAAAAVLTYLVNCPGERALNAFAFNTYLDLAMDIRADPRDDNMDLPCDAMSIALTMRGAAGHYEGFVPRTLEAENCEARAMATP